MIGTLNPGVKLGVIDNEPDGVYRTSGAISNSALSDFLSCERLFERKHIKGIVAQGRYQAFVVGQALHCWMLEGGEYAKRFAVKPEGFDGRTKEAKAWLAENTGKTSLTKDEGDTVAAMRAAVLENPEASDLLAAEGKNELTIRLHMDRWKLPVQCRLDAWRPSRDMIVDLKTTSDLAAWPREMAKFGYHRQAALYGHMTAMAFMREPPRFVFLVVSKTEPFQVGMYRLSDEWLARAWAEIDEGMFRLRKCLDSGIWRRDEPGVKVIDLPKWAKESA